MIVSENKDHFTLSSGTYVSMSDPPFAPDGQLTNIYSGPYVVHKYISAHLDFFSVNTKHATKLFISQETQTDGNQSYNYVFQ